MKAGVGNANFGETIVATRRVRIRRFTESDSSDFISFMTNTELTRFLEFEDRQKTSAGASALLKATLESYDTGHQLMAFAVECTGNSQFIGFCGLAPQGARQVEIMYAVVPDAAGKGIATEIAKALSGYALDELGYAVVTAPIQKRHRASIAVAKKAGFQLRGEDGDRVVYALSRVRE